MKLLLPYPNCQVKFLFFLFFFIRWCCRSQALFRPMPISVLLNNRVPETLPIGLAVAVPTYDPKTVILVENIVHVRRRKLSCEAIG